MKTDLSAAPVRFFKKEPVLCISGLAALISCFFVPPSAAYLGYIDMRVLCLLFCLMAVVQGFRSCRLFRFLAAELLSRVGSLRAAAVILILLPFFVSMLVTNDVALITFVPFAIMILETAERTDLLIPVIVLQTAAANLGSMSTPIGNPQNLYLYTRYSIPISEFFRVMGPLSILSLIFLMALTFLIPAEPVTVSITAVPIEHKKRLVGCTALFGLCLLTVLHILPYPVLTLIVAAAFLVIDRTILKNVDFGLLVTFVFFFVFSGNLGELGAVRDLLQRFLSASTMLCSAAASQVISNVPAAVLLSGFTEDAKGLLIGTNVGGLGTLIASLASLISFRFYAATEGRNLPKYLAVFTAVNAAGLVILLLFSQFVLL